jgi:hypothetical protein
MKTNGSGPSLALAFFLLTLRSHLPCLGIPNGQRFMTDNAGNKLFFNLCSDEARTTIWGTWYSKTVKAPAIDIPIGRSGRVTGTATLYARVDLSLESVPPGIYKSSISGGKLSIVTPDAIHITDPWLSE